MKKLFRFVAAIFVLVITFHLAGRVCAFEYENYPTELVPEQEAADFLEYANFRLLGTESRTKPITAFAVSEKGLIALGFTQGLGQSEIHVYDFRGQFLYGYRGNTGVSLVLFFEEETLSVYWGQENYIGSFDADGNCLQLRKVISTQSAADAYQNDRWRPASGAVGDLQYQAEGGFFSNRYTRFSVIDPEGNRSVIYDVTEEMQKRNLIRVLLILGAAALCLCVRCKNKKGDVRDV